MRTHLIIYILLLTNGLWSAPHNMLEKARNLFYTSVEKENRISDAIELFNQIAESDSSLAGLSHTYIGALTALKAKYSFWPHQKLSHAKKGIKIMESGIKSSPENIEALFIYGSTCHYLPFFFNKGDEAREAFTEIADLLPHKHQDYDSEMILNVVDFLLEKADLSSGSQQNIQELRIQLLRKDNLAENFSSVGGS